MSVHPERADHDVIAGRAARVGGMDVVRVLPTRGRRTVGAWCFVDLMGPDDAVRPDPMEVGPHPHIGLSTVTWLLGGRAVHTDSLGTEQPLRPGQLNLMTAGHGVAHAELAHGDQRFRGVQIWVAQPETTRHGEPAFEHHGELPEVELGGGVARLLVGELGDERSPARADTPLLGAQVTAVDDGVVTLPLRSEHEHCVVPLDGTLAVADHTATVGDVVLVAPELGEVSVHATPGERWLLLGGEPLGEDLLMWWNFVARDREEITAAHRSWQQRDERFGEVPSDLDRVEAPPPPWLPFHES